MGALHAAQAGATGLSGRAVLRSWREAKEKTGTQNIAWVYRTKKTGPPKSNTIAGTFFERESAAKSHVVMTTSNTPPRYGVDAWRDPVASKRPCKRNATIQRQQQHPRPRTPKKDQISTCICTSVKQKLSKGERLQINTRTHVERSQFGAYLLAKHTTHQHRTVVYLNRTESIDDCVLQSLRKMPTIYHMIFFPHGPRQHIVLLGIIVAMRITALLYVRTPQPNVYTVLIVLTSPPRAQKRYPWHGLDKRALHDQTSPGAVRRDSSTSANTGFIELADFYPPLRSAPLAVSKVKQKLAFFLSGSSLAPLFRSHPTQKTEKYTQWPTHRERIYSYMLGNGQRSTYPSHPIPPQSEATELGNRWSD